MPARVSIVGLGGTIACLPTSVKGAVPVLSAEALVAAIPGLNNVATIQCCSFRQIPSAHLGLTDLIALGALAMKFAVEGIEAMVVTQGTDTIEETAFALDLLVGDALPIIVTGAMRGPSQPGADGPANLLSAVQVAASGATVGRGVVVLMDDVVHSARWVRKMHTSRPSAFESPMAGPLGWISEGKVSVAWQPLNRPSLGDVVEQEGCRVALISTWVGDDGSLIDHAARAGYGGVVVQTAGGGHVNPLVADAIGRAAHQLPVVFASRTGSGEVLRQTYGYVGSETDLQKRGAIPAGQLDAVKARLLLELLLLRPGRSSAEAKDDYPRFAL